MLIIDDETLKKTYTINDAIDDVKKVLVEKTKSRIINPHRIVTEYPERQASLLYMPSSEKDGYSIMKAVSIFPENHVSTTQGVTLITDISTGNFIALLNSTYLTRLRTGALSGIATDLLAKPDPTVLTVIGTGGMAFEQVMGVLAVRNIKHIYLVNRTISNAEEFKNKLINELPMINTNEIKVTIESNVTKAIKEADIICCSTRSEIPVFSGLDVRPGTHVNGVGSYLPHMREVDFEFIKRADKIVVDDFEGAKQEAGELIHAAQQDSWTYEDIYGELKDVYISGDGIRNLESEITFFKSVGSAYFDLAVAKGAYLKAVNEKKGTIINI